MQESFEDRQTSTADALAELLKEIEKNEQRKKEQAAKGLDATDLLRALQADRRRDTRTPSRSASKVGAKFWRVPELAAQRSRTARVAQAGDLCRLAEEDDLEKVTATVEALFDLLKRALAMKQLARQRGIQEPRAWNGPTSSM